MKTVEPSADKELQELLRCARPAPALPPRFEENVWRRIERAEKSAAAAPGWLAALAGWLLKPKFALAVAAMMVLAGVGLGWHRAQQEIHAAAQARYLAAVAPNALR